MCGIAGIYDPQSSPQELQAEVQRMLALLHHRGPDDQGTWADPSVALGNCRLSILDLSSAGHQPMVSSDGSLCVVQNGEIYNFSELRKGLVEAGYTFHSHCDTEVLLHGYAHWGIDLLQRIRGMFAIAIWDARLHRLLLVRDRFGIKPLYYTKDSTSAGTRLCFASEIKPLLANRGGQARANEAVVYDFLAYGLLDHTSDSFFEGIHRLPAAHYLIIDGQQRPRIESYWDFEINPEVINSSQATDKKDAEGFRQALFDTVKHHLISDVPIASCLSGGLDSSSIVCVAKELRGGDSRDHGGQHCTFTSCYDDSRFDERLFAEEVVRKTNARSTFVYPRVEGYLAELPLLLYYQEEPIAGSACYSQWCLMRAIHQSGIKVVLDGQGGDEQLLGYGKFFLFYLQVLFRARRFDRLASEVSHLLFSPLFLRSLDLRHGLRYMKMFKSLTGENSLLSRSFAARFSGRHINLGAPNGLADRVKSDIKFFSLPTLLRHEDKNSMAFSVESRVPLVDHRFVEYVGSLHFGQKLRQGRTKYVLRKAMKGLLPESVRCRQDKMGFGTPQAVWMRLEMAETVEKTFRTAQFLPAWIDMNMLEKAYARYRRGQGMFHHQTFFRCFILESWARQFLQGNGTVKPEVTLPKEFHPKIVTV